MRAALRMVLACAMLAASPARSTQPPRAAAAASPGASALVDARQPAPAWLARLRREASEWRFPPGATVDVRVEDLATGVIFARHGAESCYLASGVKLPIAVEFLRQVEQGRASVATRVKLDDADRLDGSPATGPLPDGTWLEAGELLEFAIVHSDNTATDMLLRLVGLDDVNALMQRVVPGGFREITSLADVRRHAYSNIHPGACRLTNRQIRDLRAIPGEQERVRALAEMLGMPPEEAAGISLDEAFRSYYATELNSAPLPAYSSFLAQLARGELLCPESTDLLMGLLQEVETGSSRVKAGLPPGIAWAHKTGTQHGRVADFGIAWPRGRPERRIVITAVASGFASMEEGEAALRRVGRAVAASGIFEESP